MKPIEISNYRVKTILKIEVNKTVQTSKCPKCKIELEKILFIGDFNEKTYFLEMCTNCEECFIVVYIFNLENKNQKGGKNYGKN